MSQLLCDRCGTPAVVVYEGEPLCGPCAVQALDENQHYLVVQVDDSDTAPDGTADSRKTA